MKSPGMRSMSDDDLVRNVRPGLTAVRPFMFHVCNIFSLHQPRSQGLFPQDQGEGPGNEVEFACTIFNFHVLFLICSNILNLQVKFLVCSNIFNLHV